jgi:hypothetical protein
VERVKQIDFYLPNCFSLSLRTLRMFFAPFAVNCFACERWITAAISAALN